MDEDADDDVAPRLGQLEYQARLTELLEGFFAEAERHELSNGATLAAVGGILVTLFQDLDDQVFDDLLEGFVRRVRALRRRLAKSDAEAKADEAAWLERLDTLLDETAAAELGAKRH